METVIAIVVGIGIALIFGAGAGVTHAMEKNTGAITVIETDAVAVEPEKIETAEDHRVEGSRLLKKALYIDDISESKHLQSVAYQHFRIADILDNGPYKV